MSRPSRHDMEHGAALLRPPASDLIRFGSRRWFLQMGLAGLAGLSLPDLLRCRAQGAAVGAADRKAVILIWLSGGASHIDTWDPKPDAPREVRGPFETIATKVTGLRVCEHLPLQASIMDRLALVRSVDCRTSTDHYPAPMQAGNPLAQRTQISASNATHPSMGAVAARFRGANDPALPAFVGLADPPLWQADILGAGPLGAACEPVRGDEMVGRLNLPKGVSVNRALEHAGLCRQFDRLQRELDVGHRLSRLDLSKLDGIDEALWGAPERPAKLANNEYFVLGDFSPQSKDSRLWEQGAPGHHPYAVPESYLRGVVTHIYWPPTRWRTFR